MIPPENTSPYADLLRHYQIIVRGLHPDHVGSWPLLNGWNVRVGGFKDWHVVILEDSGNLSFFRSEGLSELSDGLIGASEITSSNREAVRKRIEQSFRVGARDAVVLWPPDGELSSEIEVMFRKHERSLGLGAMQIFLSHKGFDKPVVRSYAATLKDLGFSPWLDEDAMPAGTSLERGILKGFEDSCAAVFFVTPQFKDAGYLATEVEYAIAQKRKKGNRFAIITLVFGSGDAKGEVPDLLHGFVWKEPSSELEALREILKALPIEVGETRWRQ